MNQNSTKNHIKICKYDQYIQQPNIKNITTDFIYSNKTKKVSMHKHRLSGLFSSTQLNQNNEVSPDSSRNIDSKTFQNSYLFNNQIKNKQNVENELNGTLFRKNIQKVQKQKGQNFKLQKIHPKSVTIKFQEVLDSIPNNRSALKTNYSLKTKTISPFKIFEMAQNKFYLQLISRSKKQAQKIKQNGPKSSTIDSVFNVRSIKMIKKLSQTSPVKQYYYLTNQHSKNNQLTHSQYKKQNHKKSKYSKMFKNQNDISVEYQKQNPIMKERVGRNYNMKLSLKQLKKFQQFQSQNRLPKRISSRNDLIPLTQIRNRDKQPNSSNIYLIQRNASLIDKLQTSYNQNQIQRTEKNRRKSKQFTPMVFSLHNQDSIPNKGLDNIKFSINKKCDMVFEQKINKYKIMLQKTAKLHQMQIVFPQTYTRNQLNFYVGKGNNSKLVKQILKKRWWLGNCQDKKDISRNNVIWTQLKDKSFYNNPCILQSCENETKKLIAIHNHFEQNQFLGNKKALYYNMKAYYQSIKQNVFDYLPLTFHITKISDQSYRKFIQTYNKFKEEDPNCKNTWILKPGQNSNRGNGITVHQQIESILQVISKCQKQGRTYILQKYIQKPFLYNKRKFDIRCYMLLTRLNGKIKGYWYNEGYIRTSGYQFTLNDCENSFIHLTNDAIQQHCDNYGKFQDKNKLSYEAFQKYLDANYNNSNQSKKYNLETQILPKLRKVCIDSIKASYKCLGKWKLGIPTFQLFGLDFMIDQNFNPWLIQINTNPCLQTEGRVLQKVIVPLVDNVLKLSVDCIFPPPQNWSNCNKHLISKNVDKNKFELVFNQSEQTQVTEKMVQLRQLPLDKIGQIDEDNQIYEQ